MAKFLYHIKLLLAIFTIAVFALGSAVAVDKDRVNEKTAKTKKTETGVSDTGEKDNKLNKQGILKTDSLKAAEKMAENTKKSAEDQSKVKKSENPSSIFSYNFVFYLMYKFKIDDIFNISQEKNSITIPDKSSMLTKGKHLINRLIYNPLD